MPTTLLHPTGLRPPRRRPSRRRFAVVVAGFGLVVVASSIAGVAGYRAAIVDSGSAVRAPVTSLAPARLPLHAVAAKALSRVVTIEAVRGDGEELGTGWLLDNRGDLVTNAHVVEGHLAVRIRDRAGHTHGAALMGVDRDQDIAVIRSEDGLDGGALVLAPPGDPHLPLDVVAIASGRATGHDDITAETLTQLHQDVPVKGNPLVDPAAGTITTTYQDMMTMRGAPIFAGNSGGPLLDGTGRVLGIVTLKSRDSAQAFAIPVNRVIEELLAFAARATPAG